MSGTLNTQDVLLSLGGFGLSLVVAWSLKLFLNVLLFKKKKTVFTLFRDIPVASS